MSDCGVLLECRWCLYVTFGSLRSLYSTQELDGVSVAVLNFLQRIKFNLPSDCFC
ncbi:unnamed protein product [Brassica rapa subsp. trilocularis]